MSLIVVPLAGPDFYTKKFGIRPLYPYNGSTLIEQVLGGRAWMSKISQGDGQLIFVLRKEEPHTLAMQSFITHRFPFASTVVLSDLSLGAPMSALAGIALSKRYDMPVIVDLADIVFEWPWDPIAYFHSNKSVDAVVPYFVSQNPKFSYLRLDGLRVLEAHEKQVVSSNASAGVYVFRDVSTYLRAVGYCVLRPDICQVDGAFFVCPSVNGLITNDRQVHAIQVCNAVPVSSIFHESLPRESI